MRAKYEPPKKIENYKSSSFDELNKQGRINSIVGGLWGCLSNLTLLILTIPRMTVSKVSFSDILRNDY